MREYGRFGKDMKQGGRGKSRELGTETTHFKLARINKRVLKPCDPKVCQSKLEMGTYKE